MHKICIQHGPDLGMKRFSSAKHLATTAMLRAVLVSGQLHHVTQEPGQQVTPAAPDWLCRGALQNGGQHGIYALLISKVSLQALADLSDAQGFELQPALSLPAPAITSRARKHPRSSAGPKGWVLSATRRDRRGAAAIWGRCNAYYDDVRILITQK